MIPDIRPQVESLIANVRAEDAAEINRLKSLVEHQHGVIAILRKCREVSSEVTGTERLATMDQALAQEAEIRRLKTLVTEKVNAVEAGMDESKCLREKLEVRSTEVAALNERVTFLREMREKAIGRINDYCRDIASLRDRCFSQEEKLKGLEERFNGFRVLRDQLRTAIEVIRLSRDKWRRRAMGLRVPDVVNPSALEAAHKRIDEQAREIAVLKAVNHINKCRLERIDKNRLSMMLDEQQPKQYEPVPDNMENWCRSCDTQKASDGLNGPTC